MIRAIYKRPLVSSLCIGAIHAGVLVTVAIHLGYEIGPAKYSLVGLGWRYGGLVAVAALPVWLSIRFELFIPLLALILTSGYVLGVELTPPGPTFRDVAEVEHLTEPTGTMVVENGLYIVRYMINATVWTVGFLFTGLIEYTVRTSCSWLPSPSSITWVSLPATRRKAVAITAGGGLLHMGVMIWFAARLGVTATGDAEWLLYAYGAVGMWILAAVPIYLLMRHRYIAPATLLTAILLFDVSAEFAAGVEDPHALYFGAWFLLLGLLLIAAVVEFGIRRFDVYQ